MTIGDAIDNLTEAREHLKAGTPEYIAVVAAHDILRDLRESPPQSPASPSPDLLEAKAKDRIMTALIRLTTVDSYDYPDAMKDILAALASTPRPPEAAPARPMEPCDKCGGSGLVRKFDLRDPQDEDCEEDVPVRKGNQKPGELWLYDRADGVKGHFCVGRTMDGFCHEYWNEEDGKFCAFGTLYKSQAAANRKLRELSALLPPKSPARKEADHG